MYVYVTVSVFERKKVGHKKREYVRDKNECVRERKRHRDRDKERVCM